MTKTHFRSVLLLLTVIVSFSHLFAAGNNPRQMVKFDYDWKFIKGDQTDAQTIEFDDSQWSDVTLPHDWSIAGPFDSTITNGGAGGFLPGGIGWYRKVFTAPANKDKKVNILFDGVYHNSDVYINGHHLGHRPYGYVSFYYDLSPWLNYDDTNVIAVRVDHTDNPSSRWYSGSGIYRHVWLTVTSPLHTAQWGVYVTTPVIQNDAATVLIKTKIVNESVKTRQGTLITVLNNPNNQTCGKAETKFELTAGSETEIEQTVIVNNPVRWDLETTAMYTAQTVIKEDGKTVDDLSTPFGIREFKFDPQTGFSLNGKSMKFKGVCIHQDAGCLGTAVPERALKRRLLALKELGCNAIRMSHNPPAQELLDMCDRMGFLVIDEAFDKWLTMYYGKFFQDWWERDLDAMLLRDRNHPSIILWSVGNEVFEQGKPEGREILIKLVDYVHANEPSRPVTCALYPNRVGDRDGTNNTFAPLMDVVGTNYQEQFYEEDKAAFPERIVLSTESLIYFRGGTTVFKDYKPDNPWYDVLKHEWVTGQFLWTGIDYLGESGRWPAKGWGTSLLSTCGFFKANAWFHKCMWSEKPIVGIAVQHDGLDIDPGNPLWSSPKFASHWNLPEVRNSMVRVETPTNCESVELIVNNSSFGERTTADYPNNTIVWFVPYQKGTVQAIGRNNNVIESEYTIKTAEAAKTIQLLPDTQSINADGQDVVSIEVNLMDGNGVLVPDADRLITFTVEGEGVIKGVDSGDLRSNESYTSNSHTTYWGKMLAVVQSTRKAGTIKITATAPDLPPAVLEIKTTLNK